MNTHCTLPHPSAASKALATALPAAGWRTRAMVLGLSALLIGSTWSLAHAAAPADAADRAAQPGASSGKTAAKKPVAASSEEAIVTEKIDLGNDLKKALRESLPGRKKLTLVITDNPEPAAAAAKTTPPPKTTAKTAEQAEPVAPAVVARPRATPARTNATAPAHPKAAVHQPLVSTPASRNYIRAKAASLAGYEPDAQPHANANSSHEGGHWSYSGATGPQAWGQLKPEFNACASGKRQSPINIEDSYTLQGPAEPLNFSYQPSTGTVVNDGHSIQVNVQGNNTLTVRGTTYSLVQLQFHSPSEIQVNARSYAMGVHLMHKNADGQLAVVAVLLDPGQTNAMIDKVWTYMPLDVGDEVRMPAGLLDINDLLPKDQRYYQFLGSLTTPPCTEDVLWMVLKEPAQISAAQLRLFQQLYPNNARPVQPVNNRPIRNAK
ncbi:carbonic anhydrase [Rhodoferax antarcticus]|uniref:carbonic anhydrase n=1 Tax=Rhodoferax antarcticus TaxID=81479 RepID=UPI0022252980|nr:carbonic anhydrase family protein [Rhodoferax antarcticus]MCW2312854.1 carbonic anhydrase [Rhodoferax antarcticus]